MFHPVSEIISKDDLLRLVDQWIGQGKRAAGPVRWAQIIGSMAAEGVTHVVECGPGRVLAGLTKRIAPGIESLALTDPASIVEALARLKG